MRAWQSSSTTRAPIPMFRRECRSSCCKDLHLLTRDGQLNADARRKLKQIRHLVGLLQAGARRCDGARRRARSVVDCGAGKSYLGALLYELVLGPAGRGDADAIEARPELSEQAAARARRGSARTRFKVATGAIASDRSAAAGRTSSRRCTPAIPRPTTRWSSRSRTVRTTSPSCRAARPRSRASSSRRGPSDRRSPRLFAHPLHRRELGSHLTNVVRGLVLEAHGYKVTVTELVGWEHSAKNELILGKRVNRFDRRARATLRALLERFHVEPALVRELKKRNLDPTSAQSQATPS